MARPGFLSWELESYDDNEEMERMIQRSQSFWRSLGFRRIGISPWFAWTDSPDHPSRHLDAAQDWEGLVEGENTSISNEFEQMFRKLPNPAIEAEECIDELQRIFPDESSAENQQWLTIDQDGGSSTAVRAESVSAAS